MLQPPCPLRPKLVFPSPLRPSPPCRGHPAPPRHRPRRPCPPNQWAAHLRPCPNHRASPPRRLHRDRCQSHPSPPRGHQVPEMPAHPPWHRGPPCHPHPLARLLQNLPHHPAFRPRHLRLHQSLPSPNHRLRVDSPFRPNPPHPRSWVARCHPSRSPLCPGLPWLHLRQSSPPLPPS